MPRTIPKNVKVAAMKAYVADGKTLRQVSKEFDINPESLRRWLGDKVRPRGGYRDRKVAIKSVAPVTVRASKTVPGLTRANHRWTDTENELLRDAVLSKMTIRETVELLGRTSAAVMCQKSKLVESNFISKDDRFIPPTGIKRVRKPMTNVMSAPEVVAEVPQITPAVTPAVELKVAEPTKTASNIDLADLAKLVKEFGVNVTLNVTSEGMEVKMTN